MKLSTPVALLILAASASAQNNPRPSRPPLVTLQQYLQPLTLASFNGSTQDSIQATATDSSGNIYVAGTTFSAQFPVSNAQQAAFGDTSILRTTDLGATWARLASPPGGASNIAPDPTTPQVLFASGSMGIFKSSDSGQTWQLVYPLSLPYATVPLAIDPGNHLHIAAAAPSGILRSLDGGVTWMAAGSPCSSSCNQQLLADPSGSGTLIALGLGAAAISRDWGATFQSFGPPGAGFPTAAAFDPSHPGWIYVDKSAGVIGSLYLSTDYGSTWTPKASPSTTFSAINSLAVDPDQPNVIIAAALTAIYESSDGAATWTQKSQLPSTASISFSPDSTIPFALVPSACSPGGGLLAAGSTTAGSSAAFSPDFGATWQPPQLTQVSSVAAGPGCALYATRRLTSDAFVAKIAPDGEVIWATYLGGADQDSAVALAVNAQGDVYVTGNTSSPDFPATVPHIGVRGENAAFLTMFSPIGSLIYSVTLGGEAANTGSALAIDAGQNVYLAGRTNSLQFPATPGTLGSALQQGSYTGFLAKLSSAATLTYATYLGPSYSYPGAILVDASGDVTVAGSGTVPGTTPPSQNQVPEFVMKLDAAASQVLQFTYLPAATEGSVTGLATDSGNNLIVFGESASGTVQSTSGAFSPQPLNGCELNDVYEMNDAFVTKLAAANWQPVYTAVLRASCGVNTGALALEPNGDAVLALSASSGLALYDPILAAPSCGYSSAVAKLSADGSALEYGTYLPGCGVPGMAVAQDGSVYAGISPQLSGTATSVLHITAASSTPIALNGVSNAFSGDASGIVPGGLYSIALAGFQPGSTYLGLNPASNLPIQLNAVEVLFNGVPGSILSTAPGQVIAAAPPVLPVGAAARPYGLADIYEVSSFVSVQVLYNGVLSNSVWMPVEKVLPGLLTTGYFNLTPPSAYQFPDAYAVNQDGTQNSPTNPAALGSTIKVYASGLGETAPLVEPGAVATSASVTPVTPFYSTWEMPTLNGAPPALAISLIPGFISSVFQIQVPIPANQTGTNVGNGVQKAALALLLSVPVGDAPQAVSNIVNVYVK